MIPTPEQLGERVRFLKQRSYIAATSQFREMTPRGLRRRGKAYGPNDRCPCGSGRKVKRCCGRFIGMPVIKEDAS